jgi:outer membrane autotransporter protein
VAAGAHSLINSSVGTWRQRMGVPPQLDDGRVGLGPWLRYFSDNGDMTPGASGFSADSDFGFRQENRGHEFGMNLSVGAGFSIGVLAGDVDGTQVLATGVGSDRFDMDYSGLYGTWVTPRFYVDASMRWMDFDAVLMSAGGEQRTDGNATAFNIEAGYTGWNMGMFKVTPQVQYTRAKIDDIAPVSGSQVDLTADGGVSERVRVGLGLERTFGTAGGVSWTPYGAVSAVSEMDGDSSFSVDGNPLFSGTTSTDGTSALVEAGVGVQFGGLSVTGGLNWTDGGAIDSSTGGQLVLRYTW